MQGELVSILTSDNVRLDGFHVQSSGPVNHRFDAAVISHGLGGNFYGAKLLKHMAGFLTEQGISCILGNNRGHDIINWSSRSAKLATLGAAYETVGECVFDVEAWVNFLVERGYKRILLAGHSLGAIKTLYAAAHQNEMARAKLDPVAGIVALSATRLNHRQLMNSPGGDKFRSMIELAGSMREQGQGSDLIKVTFPFPTWMTADAYLEKYGPSNRYDWIAFSDDIQLPTLLMFGERELTENPAFDGLQEEVDHLAERMPNYKVSIVDGADHFYSFQYKLVRLGIEEWLDG